jgi:hypothetical protein
MKILTTEETGDNCVPWGTSDPKPQQQKRRSKDKNEIILQITFQTLMNLHYTLLSLLTQRVFSSISPCQ